MPTVKLHQDVFGHKAHTSADLSDAEAQWALSLGYASVEDRSGEDQAGEPVVGYDASQDQTSKEVRGDEGLDQRSELTDAGVVDPPEALQTPEAFDPSQYTVAQVEEYLDSGITDAERSRVLAVEAENKNRAGLVGDSDSDS